MKEFFQERFPAQKFSEDKLRNLAERARRAHAGNAAPAPRSALFRTAPFLFVNGWMKRLNIGVLDMAAAIAIVCLIASAAGVYLNRRDKEQATADAQDARKNPAPKPEHHETAKKFSQAGDGRPDPMEVLAPPPPVLDPLPEVDVPADVLQKATLGDGPWVSSEPGRPLFDARERAPLEPDTLPEALFEGPSKDYDGMTSPERAPAPVISSRGDGTRRLLAKRNGGSKATEDSVEMALRWLAYHQEADGHWDSLKFGSTNKVDTAITALCVIAFIDAGNTQRVGQWKPNVQRAVQWLISKQQRSGLVFDQTDAGSFRGIGYPTAIASLALAKAAGSSHLSETVVAAQGAIEYDTQVQLADSNAHNARGWRYYPKSPGDLSVTAWFCSALQAARAAHLYVDGAAIEGAINFLNSVQIGQGYCYQAGKEATPRLTAMGNYCREIFGSDPADLKESVDLMSRERAPEWGQNGASVDLCYWHYGTHCAFYQGGDTWVGWNNAMKRALTENQCRQGDDAGSWPIVGEYSGEWGRVGQTALACQCLEIYYEGALRSRIDDARSAAAAAKLTTAPVRAPDKILQSLQVKVSFNLVNQPLSKAVEFLNNLTDCEIKLSDEAAKSDSTVTLHVTEMPMALSLDWIARQNNLEWRTEKGSVILDVPRKQADPFKQAPALNAPPPVEKQEPAKTPPNEGF